ncbi:MAG TPA: hypothetical protein VEQ36_10790 [Thermomicrobiales bacterium]|nr:hypothetical protein [Thermomicrobiales bacterium]
MISTQASLTSRHAAPPPVPVAVEREATPRIHDIICLGGLLVLALAIGIIWMPYSLYRLDNLTFYLPWYTELGKSLRSLDIPGWIPTTLSGAPMAGDPQSGWGYLPAMVIMTAFPSLFGYKLFLMFHLLFAALTSYLYARNLGMAPIGAMTTGIVFTFGNFLERTSCCTIHMQVAIWIPAVFLCIDRSQRATTRNSRLGWLLLAGVGSGQIAAGWVGQGAYYGGLAVAAYLLYRFLIAPLRQASIRSRIIQLVSSGVVIGAISGSLAATAILPRLDVVSRSTLANLYDDGAGARSGIGWSVAVLAERALGEAVREGRWYLGVVSLAMAIMAPLLLRRRDVTFFAVYTLAVLSLIVKGSPLITAFSLLPQFRSLHSHSPDRIYIILFIGPAVLAGFLVDALGDRRRRSPGHSRVILVAELPAVLMIGALILVQARQGVWLPLYQVVLVFAVCVVVGLGLLRVRAWMAPAAIVGVIALLLADMPGGAAWTRLTDQGNRDSASQTIDRYLEPNGAARWLQARRDEGEVFRFFGYDLASLTIPIRRETYAVGHYRPQTASVLVNNRGISFNLDDIQGYNPVQIRRYVTYFRYLNNQSQSYHTSNVLENGIDSPLLNMLNVRYIVAPAQIPPGRPDLIHLTQRYRTVYLDDTSRILENPDALPRTWIVHEAVKTRTGQILPQFVDASVDPGSTVLIDSEVPALDAAVPGVAETVEIVHTSNDEIRLRVNAASRGMVILSEIWDPGWTVTVDGNEAKIYRADFLFRGVVVDQGAHEIVLRFPATKVKQTLLFYLIPLIAFGLLGIVALRDRRKSEPIPPESWDRPDPNGDAIEPPPDG